MSRDGNNDHLATRRGRLSFLYLIWGKFRGELSTRLPHAPPRLPQDFHQARKLTLNSMEMQVIRSTTPQTPKLLWSTRNQGPALVFKPTNHNQVLTICSKPRDKALVAMKSLSLTAVSRIDIHVYAQFEKAERTEPAIIASSCKEILYDYILVMSVLSETSVPPSFIRIQSFD